MNDQCDNRNLLSTTNTMTTSIQSDPQKDMVINNPQLLKFISRADSLALIQVTSVTWVPIAVSDLKITDQNV